ncbi:hypothetical protein HOY80DRAFT_138621 [Tuber brumale]|nr:hypothetical protein HOY80DRAFT_138621 [Tuber brumale]
MEKPLGPEHPQVLDTMDRLGEMLLDLKKHIEVEVMCRCAVVGGGVTLGPKHRDALPSVNNLRVELRR